MNEKKILEKSNQSIFIQYLMAFILVGIGIGSFFYIAGGYDAIHHVFDVRFPIFSFALCVIIAFTLALPIEKSRTKLSQIIAHLEKEKIKLIKKQEEQ